MCELCGVEVRLSDAMFHVKGEGHLKALQLERERKERAMQETARAEWECIRAQLLQQASREKTQFNIIEETSEGEFRVRDTSEDREHRRLRMWDEVEQHLRGLGLNPQRIYSSDGRHLKFVLADGISLDLRPGWTMSRTTPRVAVVGRFGSDEAIDEETALDSDILVVGLISNNPEVGSRFWVIPRERAQELAKETHGFVETEKTPESEENWSLIRTPNL